MTKAMPLIMKGNQFLELRNAADQPFWPATQLKTGEDAREAARRAADEFFGLDVNDAAIKEGFPARIDDEVVAVYPVDSNKMEMSLLRPAESVAAWAWRDVPKSMGNVVALGFPRNIERRNGLVNFFGPAAAPASEPYPAERAPAPDAAAAYGMLLDSVAAKAAALRDVSARDFPARHAELEQEMDNLRLVAADMEAAGGRVNADEQGRTEGAPVTARALIQGRDGKILAARQKQNAYLLLPGGHIEENEAPRDALLRELQEELGLNAADALTDESYKSFTGDGPAIIYVVDADKLDLSAVTPGDDVADIEFVDAPFTDSCGAVHAGRANGDKGADAAEIERHLEGIEHEVGEMVRENAGERRNHIEKLPDGKYRLLSHDGKNLGTFESHAEAAKHEGDVEWFKEHGNGDVNVKQKVINGWKSGKCIADMEKEFGVTITVPEDLREQHRNLVSGNFKVKKNDADAGSHGHNYPGGMAGAFPVLLCNGQETVATQEADGWRCEECGAVIAGPHRETAIP